MTPATKMVYFLEGVGSFWIKARGPKPLNVLSRGWGAEPRCVRTVPL